ncbi:hypothetical protein QBC43DRAFT_361989 [Cladorrhinum sp. PSN259]|nr:hypothetical protein QBC43DRAFT_361989 [Cladorrhinum sp. PSN259]
MTKTGSQYKADAAMASPPKPKGKAKAVKDSGSKTKTAVSQRARKSSKKGVISLGNLFMSLPAELRQEIFFQALRKPNIHHLVVKRGKNPDGTWYPYYDPKKGDRYSGYRFSGKLKLVSADANLIARVNNTKPMAIPSYSTASDALMDVGNDLISFEFATGWDTGMFGGWGLGSSPLLSRGLNREDMIKGPNDTLAHVKRIAIHFRHDREEVQTFKPMPFPCNCHRRWVQAVNSKHSHAHWRFCTIECAGFLDCFPSLEEVYFILQDEPQMERKRAVYSSKVKDYAKNFWSVPQHVRKELGYAVFHEAKRTYIELDPRLAVDFKPGAPGLLIRLDDGSYMFPTEENMRTLGWSRMKVGDRWTKVNNYHGLVGFYPQKTLYGHSDLKMVLKLLRLDMLRDAGFEADQMLDEHITLDYALAREQRLALKFKVLIRTDGECKGWPLGDPRGDLLRNISSKDLVEQTYDLEDEGFEDGENEDGESEDDESES